jgi:hypothetical protein
LRDESLRATAEKLRVLSVDPATRPDSPAIAAPPAFCLRFLRDAEKDELREVREILASSPGRTPVQLVFETDAAEPMRVAAGENFSVTVSAELKEKLARWLSATLTEAVAAKASEES